MARFAVILAAAGRSTRFGDPGRKKTFADLDGRAVWLRAADPFLGRADVGRVILAIAPEDRELFEIRYAAEVAFHAIAVVEGGAERFETIDRALVAVPDDCEYVAVHDAARPCLTTDQVDAVFAAAIAQGAALLAVPVADTLKRAGADGLTIETVPRANLHAAQTPQVFRLDLLVAAHANRHRVPPPITDDAQLVEALGTPCRLVASTAANLKITTQADLALALAILRARPKAERSGFLHPFSDDRVDPAGTPKRTLDDLF